MKKCLFIIVSLLEACAGVIYHLNDTEYDRLPKLFDLDDYASCLRHNGTYCVVRFHVVAEPGTELLRLINEYSEHTKKHFNYSYIDRGICVSETCREHTDGEATGGVGMDDMRRVLEQCVNPSLRGVSVRVAHVRSCETSVALAERTYTSADWLVATLALIILALNLLATVYDGVILNNTENEKKNDKFKRCVLSFSLFKNWDRVNSLDRDNKYKGLHGIRVICTFMVVYVHVPLVIQATFLSNPHDLELSYDITWKHIILNGVTMVQAFFLMSGFLTMLSLEKYFESNQIQWRVLSKILLLRWWRMAPACGAMIAFSATWLRCLGSGPLWKLLVTDSIVKDCRMYWWQHVFFINNLDDENKFCAIQNWHVAVESQLYYIGLIVYVVSSSRPKLRSWIFGGLLIVGLVSPAIHVWLYDLEAQLMLTPEVYRNLLATSKEFHNTHGYVQNNLFCYILGMVMGRWIRKRRFTKENVIYKSKMIHNIISSLGWLTIATMLCLFMLGRFILFSDSSRIPLHYRMLYAALHRPIFGCLVAVIIILLMTTKDKFTEFMEWQCWVVPSRLSYSVYLVHFPILHIYAGLRQNLTYLNEFDMLLIQLGVVTVSFVVALALYLMVETPMTGLLKEILRENTNVKQE